MYSVGIQRLSVHIKRSFVVKWSNRFHTNWMLDAAYFLEKAEQCFRLSAGAGLNAAVAEELRNMGHEFMAKAVYIDTLRNRPTPGR
jgi:hypothetical protein